MCSIGFQQLQAQKFHENAISQMVPNFKASKLILNLIGLLKFLVKYVYCPQSADAGKKFEAVRNFLMIWILTNMFVLLSSNYKNTNVNHWRIIPVFFAKHRRKMHFSVVLIVRMFKLFGAKKCVHFRNQLAIS